MIDDDMEINLAPDRTGSAKRIRSGRKRAMAVINRTNGTPKWLRELKTRRKPAAVSTAKGTEQ